MQATVQWRSDNPGEIEAFLRAFEVRADKVGETCQIIGLAGLHIALEPGDSLVLDGSHLGVIRHAKGTPVADPAVTWKGDNVAEIAGFLSDVAARLDVVGNDLFLHGKKRPVVVHRGDVLIKRHGQIVVSVVGKDHRV